MHPKCWSEVKWSEVAQSCLILCNPMDCSPPGSSIHGILQERILDWVAIFFSRGSSWPRDRNWISHLAGRSGFSHVQFFATQWTVACQAPVSMGLSRQPNWSGLPCLPPRGLPNPGIKPASAMSSALKAGSLTLAPPTKPRWSISVLLDSLQPHRCSIPGFPVLHHLPESAQAHVHWVSDAIQPVRKPCDLTWIIYCTFLSFLKLNSR